MTLQQLWSAWLWKPPHWSFRVDTRSPHPAPKKTTTTCNEKNQEISRVIPGNGPGNPGGGFFQGIETNLRQFWLGRFLLPNDVGVVIWPKCSCNFSKRACSHGGHSHSRSWRFFPRSAPTFCCNKNQDLQLLGLYKFEFILLMSVECAEQSGWTWVRHCLNLEKKNTYPGIILSNQNRQSGI